MPLFPRSPCPKVCRTVIPCNTGGSKANQDLETGTEEFLLDANEPMSGDIEFIAPQEPEASDAMAIDEEGRPRFAPAKDIVSATRCLNLPENAVF